MLSTTIQRRFFTNSAGTAAALALLASPAFATGAAEVADFRTKTEKWVETSRIISEEKADWVLDRETLRATRDLLKQEKKALEEEIAELDASAAESDEERRELLLARGDARRAADTLETELAAMEQAVLALVPRLPEPLQRKLKPLLVQIPEDPEQSRVPLGQRLIAVLGVLAQAEKWNDTATFVGETRAISADAQAGDAPKVQVRTLYWGLAEAIYVDSQGTTAGIGRPGPEGWVFEDDPALVDEASLLLDIYEGNVDAIEFVELPVEIR